MTLTDPNPVHLILQPIGGQGAVSTLRPVLLALAMGTVPLVFVFFPKQMGTTPEVIKNTIFFGRESN